MGIKQTFSDINERWNEFKEDHPKTATAIKIAGIALAVPAAIGVLSGAALAGATVCMGAAMIAPPLAGLGFPLALAGEVGLHALLPLAATAAAAVAGVSAVAGGVTYARENEQMKSAVAAPEEAKPEAPSAQVSSKPKPSVGPTNAPAIETPAVDSNFTTAKRPETVARQTETLTSSKVSGTGQDDYGRAAAAPEVAIVAEPSVAPVVPARAQPEAKSPRPEAPQPANKATVKL